MFACCRSKKARSESKVTGDTPNPPISRARRVTPLRQADRDENNASPSRVLIMQDYLDRSQVSINVYDKSSFVGSVGGTVTPTRRLEEREDDIRNGQLGPEMPQAHKSKQLDDLNRRRLSGDPKRSLLQAQAQIRGGNERGDLLRQKTFNVPVKTKTTIRSGGETSSFKKSETKIEKFDRIHKLQCTFCFGKACWSEKWGRCNDPVIEGLHSNIVEDKLIGSQRPSTRLMAQYNVLAQMLALNIGVVVNLQQPGEHSLCGDGIDDTIGFSYNPEVFQAAGISTYNWCWEDLTCPSNELTLMICQNISRFDSMGKRIFVHCHAGTGRTGLIIACYLFYSNMVDTGAEAVSKVQTQRQGALKRNSQRSFVVGFCGWLENQRSQMAPVPTSTTSSYQRVMASNILLMHGEDCKRFKYYPKFLGLCLSRLQALRGCSSKVTANDFLRKVNSFKETTAGVSQSSDGDRLRKIYTNTNKDEWSLLETETDSETLLAGIFGFLRSFSETAAETGEHCQQFSALSSQRNLTFLFGLLYYFASLMDCLKSAQKATTLSPHIDEEAKQTTETCYESLIQMIPQELLRAELDRLNCDTPTLAMSLIAKIKDFENQLSSSSSMLVVIQKEVQEQTMNGKNLKMFQSILLQSAQGARQ